MRPQATRPERSPPHDSTEVFCIPHMRPLISSLVFSAFPMHFIIDLCCHAYVSHSTCAVCRCEIAVYLMNMLGSAGIFQNLVFEDILFSAFKKGVHMAATGVRIAL